MTTLNHYRKRQRCRVSKTLPCAQTRAHGKLAICRVPIETAHSKLFLCRVSDQKTHSKCPTHSKLQHLPCAAKGSTRQTFSTRQRAHVCRVPAILHTANLWHTAKLCKKKQTQHSQFFLLCIYSVLYSLLKSVIFLVILAIFSHLISLIEFWGFNLKCFEQWSIMDRKMIFMLWSLI